MLVSTELISLVKACLEQAPKYNLIPVHFPYSLKVITEKNSKVSYKFEADVKYNSRDYLSHVIILALTAISIFYQVVVEDKEVLQATTHMLFGLIMSVNSYFAYMQYLESQKITNYLNELLRFEERWLQSNARTEGNQWKKVEYRNLAVAGLCMNQISSLLVSLSFAVNAGLFPLSPWRLIPAGILEEFSRIAEFCNWRCFVLAEVIRRSISFTFTCGNLFVRKSVYATSHPFFHHGTMFDVLHCPCTQTNYWPEIRASFLSHKSCYR